MNKKSYPIRSFLTAVIERDEDTAKVAIHSEIHVNRVCELPHSYSPQFTDTEILADRDFRKFVDNRYGTI